MKTAILAILLFGLLIFPHELGHFIAAKKFDVKVNEFSFGMGPALYKKQRGETLYAIRLIPIGGYCAMEGEDGDSNEERAFNSKEPWKKLIILFAGALMNLIVCLALVFSIYVIGGYTTTVIDSVSIDSPAYVAGIESGDKITYIDGKKINSWNDVILSDSIVKGEEANITVKRGNAELSFNVTPEPLYLDDGSLAKYVIGITSKAGHNPFVAFYYSFEETGSMIGMIFESFKMLVNGEATMKDMAGPIGVIQIVDETSSYGFSAFLILAALISVNVGVINLFPLPALDGGRIIFVLYTMITKKKVSEKVEGTVHAIGIVLLLALSVLIAFNDVLRIFG